MPTYTECLTKRSKLTHSDTLHKENNLNFDKKFADGSNLFHIAEMSRDKEFIRRISCQPEQKESAKRALSFFKHSLPATSQALNEPNACGVTPAHLKQFFKPSVDDVKDFFYVDLSELHHYPTATYQKLFSIMRTYLSCVGINELTDKMLFKAQRSGGTEFCFKFCPGQSFLLRWSLRHKEYRGQPRVGYDIAENIDLSPYTVVFPENNGEITIKSDARVVKISSSQELLEHESNNIKTIASYNQKKGKTKKVQNNAVRVVKIKHPGDYKTRYAVVQRFEAGINLRTFLINHKGKKLTSKQLRTIAYNTMLAVQELHGLGMVYFDLKSSQFLIDPQTLQVKILDFESSRVGKIERNGEGKDKILLSRSEVLGSSKDIMNTDYYRAPETCYEYHSQHETEGFDQTADYYSLGVTLATILMKDDKTKTFKPNSSPETWDGKELDGFAVLYAHQFYSSLTKKNFYKQKDWKIYSKIVKPLLSVQPADRGHLDDSLAEFKKTVAAAKILSYNQDDESTPQRLQKNKPQRAQPAFAINASSRKELQKFSTDIKDSLYKNRRYQGDFSLNRATLILTQLGEYVHGFEKKSKHFEVAYAKQFPTIILPDDFFLSELIENYFKISQFVFKEYMSKGISEKQILQNEMPVISDLFRGLKTFSAMILQSAEAITLTDEQKKMLNYFSLKDGEKQSLETKFSDVLLPKDGAYKDFFQNSLIVYTPYRLRQDAAWCELVDTFSDRETKGKIKLSHNGLRSLREDSLAKHKKLSREYYSKQKITSEGFRELKKKDHDIISSSVLDGSKVKHTASSSLAKSEFVQQRTPEPVLIFCDIVMLITAPPTFGASILISKAIRSHNTGYSRAFVSESVPQLINWLFDTDYHQARPATVGQAAKRVEDTFTPFPPR